MTPTSAQQTFMRDRRDVSPDLSRWLQEARSERGLARSSPDEGADLKLGTLNRLCELARLLHNTQRVRRTLEFIRERDALKENLRAAMQEKSLDKTLQTYRDLIRLDRTFLPNPRKLLDVELSLENALPFIRSAVVSFCNTSVKSGDLHGVLRLADELAVIGLSSIVDKVVSVSICQTIAPEFTSEDSSGSHSLRADDAAGLGSFIVPLNDLYSSIQVILHQLDLNFDVHHTTRAEITQAIFIDVFNTWTNVVNQLLTGFEQHLQGMFFSTTSSPTGCTASLAALDAAVEEIVLVDRVCKAQHALFTEMCKGPNLRDVSTFARIRQQCWEIFPVLRILGYHYLQLEDQQLQTSVHEFTLKQSNYVAGTRPIINIMLDDLFFMVSRSVRRSFAFIEPSIPSNLLKNIYVTLLDVSRKHINSLSGQSTDKILELFHPICMFPGDKWPKSREHERQHALKFFDPLNSARMMSLRLCQLLKDSERLMRAIFTRDISTAMISDTLERFDSLAGELSASCDDYLCSVSRARLSLLSDVLEQLATTSYIISTEAYESVGCSCSWVNEVCVLLLSDFSVANDILTKENAELLIQLHSETLAARLENIVTTRLNFNHLGALKFERELRQLFSGLSGATTLHLRGNFARLTQLIVLLSAETQSEVEVYLVDMQHHESWKLSENDIKKIMKLRVDFT